MKKIFGFIGAGNMGGALARAARRELDADQLLITDRIGEKADELAKELGAKSVSNADVAQNADFIFLGVKPQVMDDMLAEIKPVLDKRSTPFVLVSMAAGIKIERIRAAAGNYPVIRIMPNIPCSIGAGVILYTCDSKVTDEAKDAFLSAMNGAGRLVPLAEKLFDSGCALSGCGPAYVDLFIEAMADGGVACGVPRDTAMILAAETLIGSAKLMLESGRHPGELKDAVCSPGGSTIEGVRALEQSGFRSGVIDAVIAAYKRNQQLG